MSQVNKSTQENIKKLSSHLLKTLDEKIFFSHLCDYLAQELCIENMMIFSIRDNQSAKLVLSKNELSNLDDPAQKGIIKQVLKTKKSYYSNSTDRDPIFSQDIKSVLSQRELCIPVTCEGITIALILLQSDSLEFNRDHITKVNTILNELEIPLKNLKMFTSLKNLNESLLDRIEKNNFEQQSKSSKVGQNKKDQRYGEKIGSCDLNIIYKSDSMKKVVSLVEKVSMTDAHLSISGESGTGKSLIAKNIHAKSSRYSESFVKLDCSTFNERQLELALFGEVVENLEETKVISGALDSANKGTLFLEEISNVSLDLQVKIAHFLSDGFFFRRNSNERVYSDVRLISSSSKSLKDLVEEQKFREDLFYAIMTVSIEVPSLKDRTEDIEVLSYHFLNNGKDLQSQKVLSPCVLKTLTEYHWPGNIRELQNVLERAYILSDRSVIEEVSLLEELKLESDEENNSEANDSIDVFSDLTLEELERRHICKMLDHLGGNKTKTAKSLGITVKTLYNKLHSYGMINKSKDAYIN